MCLNESLKFSSNVTFENRFPVNRRLLNPLNGRQISATGANVDIRFRDRSKDVILGQTRTISSNGFAWQMSILSNTTIESSAKLLTSMPSLRAEESWNIPLLLLNLIKPNHFNLFAAFIKYHTFILMTSDILHPQCFQKRSLPIRLLPRPYKRSCSGNSTS